MRALLHLFTASLIPLLGANLQAADKVIVHEWGTFTCLQDEQGHAISGINVDDEPVPNFVYGSQTGDVVALDPKLGLFGLPPYSRFASKAGPLPSGDPSVTMRLETPVLYIYPPKGQSAQSVPALDVHVDFHGGFLTQFYPDAASTSFAGQNKITGDSTSSLDWKDVRLGSSEKPVETDDKVWTTPREVSAPLLEVHPKMKDVNGVVHDDAQVERFLFYRGVGHLDSPLMLASNPNGPIGFQSLYAELTWPHDGGIKTVAWLAEIHGDGTCAFRNNTSLQIGDDKSALNFPSDWLFKPNDFSTQNLTHLKASMHAALVNEGLYDDEATAMLKTWELSYFKSPGLRFFYIVPRAWVDEVLPLKITGAPTDITRVMVGRIELITDAQKAALTRLSAGPSPDLASVKQAAANAFQGNKFSKADPAAFDRGEKPLSDLGIPIPPLVQDYLNLGRFRDALIVHEQQRHPSRALAQFIRENQLVPQQN